MADARTGGIEVGEQLAVTTRLQLARATLKFAKRKPLGAFGGLLVLVFIVVAVLAPLIAPYDPNELFSEHQLEAPGPGFLLGTDNYGRDVLSRVIFGAQISMYVGIVAVGVGIAAATTIGVVSGYFAGRVDMVIQRIVDTIMCFPCLILMLTLMTILGAGMTNVAFALAITLTFGNSRVVRSAVLSIKENQYMEAARAIGCSNFDIVFRYVLPNVFAPIIVIATIGLGRVILAESSLSFLGFGVPPPAPSWGGVIGGPGREYLVQAPWIATFSGIAISLSVFGFNMLGDALRDVLDPRLRGS
ncbi:MAG: ABC transporter permease [Chloroflexota bacterium]